MLRTRLLVPVAAAALLLASGAAADMIPLVDLRENSADATLLGVTDAQFHYPSGSFAYFEDYATAYVPDPDPEGSGSCGASAFQVSQFLPNGISMSGSTGGSWYAIPGNYSALSFANFKFSLDRCHEYQYDAWLDPGDFGESRLAVAASGTQLEYEGAPVGEIHTTGRLPAGTYEVEGKSYIITDRENTTGPTYTILWTCVPCVTTLVAAHPQPRTVACGGTAVFTVAPTTPVPATLTYQWRRNLVPLTNGPGVSGATSPTLTLTNVCTADAGYYDVVLSDGTIVEPSQLAQLFVTTAVTGVDVADASQVPFSFQLAGPNPFGAETSFRFSAAKPQRATIVVFNASGAVVRTLVDGMVSGAGTFRWDGTTRTGARAPAGIYFVRIEAGALRESRKVVLLK
jgi:hypothetical protein